jgi:HAD superfamily hydrolase (TIGR01484 family)
MPEIKLIASDWEGTITESGGGRVPWPSDDIDKLANIMDEMRTDIEYPPFVLNTGRQAPYVEAALQAVHAFWEGYPSICENGCIFYYPTTKEFLIHPIAEDIEDEIPHIRKSTFEIIKRVTGVEEPIKKYGELGKEYSISVSPPEGKVEWIYGILKEELAKFEEIIEITHSKSAVDITPKGVNKGSALDYLSKLTSIPIENMLGIGDSHGDIKSLERTGISAAPSNATEEIKNIVKYVSPYPTTRGVIDILYEFVPRLKVRYTKGQAVD